MRTGSNHLEASLTALSDVTAYGEIFNPVFLGAHNRDALFGMDMAAREVDPLPLLDLIRANTDGLPGFRYFHDHDPRVLDTILDDPRTAKIVLTRNPLDAYVSLAIARQTGQWRLTNPKMAKAAQARFDSAEFDALLAAQQGFRDRIQTHLQRTGQTAFWISYEQIGDLAVLNGLAAFLGSADRLAEVPGKLKKQNPGQTADKVENADEMRAHLARLDPFQLSRSTHLEPSRPADVAPLMAAAESPLLCLPLPGGATAALRDWMTRLDGAPPHEGLKERELRPWMRKAKGFTSFAVLRHPLARAHDAFVEVLTDKGPEANTIRRILTNQHGVALPAGPEPEAHAAGFLGFLTFLKANLNGQSALPVKPIWASQAETLAGLAQVVLPQRLIRETDAQADLDGLAQRVGRAPQPLILERPGSGPTLLQIYRPEQDDAVIDAYRRDFFQFGFRRWKNS